MCPYNEVFISNGAIHKLCLAVLQTCYVFIANLFVVFIIYSAYVFLYLYMYIYITYHIFIIMTR